jgi:hypothetical protein
MSDDLISRNALLKWLCEGCNGAKKIGCGSPCCDYDLIMQAPAVDAVEVVRCKECKAFGESPWGHFQKGWCKIHGRHRDPEYYCASGVRKDAEEDT